MRGFVIGIVMVCACGGDGGGGGGEGGTYTQDQANDACVSFGSCIGGDGINDCFTDVLPTLPPATVRCMAAAGADCNAVKQCMGLMLTVDASCPTGYSCDGDNAVECADGLKISQACGTIGTTGPTCVLSSTGRSSCGVASCSVDMQTCNGTVAQSCNADIGILREVDCADFGLECISGVCTSPGGGGACTPGTAPHCNGAAIESCQNGTTVLLDCAARTPGASCHANATDAFCSTAAPGDCFPDKGAETCSGSSLTYCAGGVTTTVDCVALGFSSCFAGSCMP